VGENEKFGKLDIQSTGTGRNGKKLGQREILLRAKALGGAGHKRKKVLEEK
jgi:hypothetical protein